MNKQHPFYCYKKKCRKSAWDTPEYLSDEDWEFVRKAVLLDVEQLFEMLWMKENAKLCEAFFYKVLGWPEGLTYCRNYGYWQNTAFPALEKHEFLRLRKLLSERRAESLS